MTCIVGLVHNNITYVGGDSCISTESNKWIIKDSKIIKLKNGVVLGFAGNPEIKQMIDYKSLIDEEIAFSKEVLINNFLPKLSKALEEKRITMKSSNIIVGFEDKLFKVEDNFIATENYREVTAIGSGSPYALGSLFTTINMTIPPQDKIIKALEAAQEFSTRVDKPFYIFDTKKE